MEDIKPTSTDDEFHFSEAEEASPYSSAVGEESAGIKSKFNRRNVLIAVVIIAAAIALYKLIGVFSGSSGTRKSTPVVTRTIERRPIPSRTVSIPTLPTPTRTTSPALSTALQDQLSQMHQHNVQSSNQVESINTNLHALSNSVANLQGVVAAMNQQLQTVSAQLQQQHTAILALRPKKVKRRGPRVGPASPIRPKWYIQALLPGRAWLFQADGNNITVRTGDSLAGYGKIKDILVVKGVVMTSSGAIIRYRGM